MSSHIAIDTEHGGFHPSASLLSIGFAVFNPITGDIIDTMSLNIQHDIYSVDALALEVNKINIPEHHKTALPINECRSIARKFLGKHCKSSDDYLIPVGSGVLGDIKMLKDNSFYTSKLSYKTRDITVIASVLVDSGKLPQMKVGLQNLADYFGVNPGVPHSALDDAVTSAKVYWKLMNLVRGVEISPYEGCI